MLTTKTHAPPPPPHTRTASALDRLLHPRGWGGVDGASRCGGLATHVDVASVTRMVVAQEITPGERARPGCFLRKG